MLRVVGVYLITTYVAGVRSLIYIQTGLGSTDANLGEDYWYEEEQRPAR